CGNYPPRPELPYCGTPVPQHSSYPVHQGPASAGLFSWLRGRRPGLFLFPVPITTPSSAALGKRVTIPPSQRTPPRPGGAFLSPPRSFISASSSPGEPIALIGIAWLGRNEERS